MLSELTQFFLRHGHSHVPSNVKEYSSLYDWTQKIRLSKVRLESSLIDELDTMQFHWGVTNAWEANWHYRYQDLLGFYNEHGHCDVPRKKHSSLRSWVRAQRRKESNLSAERKELLNRLNFRWSAQIIEEQERQWMMMYQRLLGFRKEYGHCRVPSHYSEDISLASWVTYQRSREDKIREDRKALLNDIGFAWSKDIQEKREEDWMQSYKELKTFYKKNGHSLVLPSHGELSIWVKNLRRGRKYQSPEQLKLLEAVEFVWDAPEYLWKKGYQKLLAFHKKYGHCRVPKSYEDSRLASWVRSQRRAKNKMAERHFKLLEAIHFCWKPILELEKKWEVQWMRRYEELKEYYQKNGHSKVPRGYPPNPPLANWVEFQQSNKHKLTDKQIHLLESIDFQWSVPRAKEDGISVVWRENYKKVKEFYQKNQHYSIPKGYPERDQLKSWIIYQMKYSKRLSEKQKKLLQDINFPWDRKKSPLKRRADKWMDRYEQLKAFYEEHKHFRVLKSHNRALKAWVYSQRIDKNISEERKKLLDAINFEWKLEHKGIWDKRYQELLQFYQEHGHCRVPPKYEKNKKLGSWVGTQRLQSKKLSAERKELLDKIGFLWSEDIKKEAEERWMSNYQRLVAFQKQHGHCRVTVALTDERFVTWVTNQKRRKATLTTQRYQLLDKIQFWE